MPFELVHLPGSGSVPSWLSDSALAPFVADAVQLEHLLRVVACSAAHRFLLAGARRHGTCLASLAACYFFRMVRCAAPSRAFTARCMQHAVVGTPVDPSPPALHRTPQHIVHMSERNKKSAWVVL